jgi:hypothetical protein
MALVLGGVGSVVLQEIGKLALEHTPMLQQFAKTAVVDIAKKTFNKVLEDNPNFSNFLGHMGISSFHFGHTKTNVLKRGRHRTISYS